MLKNDWLQRERIALQSLRAATAQRKAAEAGAEAQCKAEVDSCNAAFKLAAERRRNQIRTVTGAILVMLVAVVALVYWGSMPCRWLDRILGQRSGCVAEMKTNIYAQGIVFSPKGDLLAAYGYNEAELWDVGTGQLLKSFRKSGCSPAHANFSTEGDTLTMASSSCTWRDQYGRTTIEPSTVTRWDVASGKVLQVVTATAPYTNYLALSGDGETVAWSNTSCSVRLLDVMAERQSVFTSQQACGAAAAALSPKSPVGVSVALLGADGKYEWNWWTLGGVGVMTGWGTTTGFNRVLVSPTSKYVCFYGGYDNIGLVAFVDGRANDRLLGGFGGYGHGVAFSGDDRTVAVIVSDGTVWLFDADIGNVLRTIKAHSAGAAVAVSQDGKLLASTGNDRKVMLWRIAN